MFPTFLTLAQATQASLSTWHPTTLWEYLLTVVMWGVVGIVTLLISIAPTTSFERRFNLFWISGHSKV